MITWFLKILRMLFGFFDRIAFFLVGLIYELFMLISEAGIFSQAIIQEFASRIYVFLGLIMVFKVSISLVSYILNPDNFAKADVGAPALLKGFAFALVGIVLVPYVFEAAYYLQRLVLRDNLIGNLIMGMDSSNNTSGNFVSNAGKNMAFTSLTAFVRLDSEFEEISEACSANPVTVVDGTAANFSDSTATLSTECGTEISEILGTEAVASLLDAYQYRSINSLLDWDLLNLTVKNKKTNKDDFVISYLPIVSTFCGLFMAYILLLFCVEIAIRSVKLGFLQLIAPIPIIAKVDPKKGGKIFDNWLKECVTTYLDVFLRLAAIYFVLFIINAVTVSANDGIYNVVTGEGFSGVSGIFVKIFIIVGALDFARELPKLLGKILGIDFKGMGGFSLNPMKNKNLAPLGAIGSAVTGLSAGFSAAGGKKGPLPSAGRAIIGAVGGAGRGLIGSMTGQNAGDIMKQQAAINHDKLMNPHFSTAARLKNRALGYTGFLNPLEKANQFEGKPIEEQMKDIDENKIAPAKAEKDVYDSILSKNKDMRSQAESEILKSADKTDYSKDIYEKKNMIDVLKAQAGNIKREDYNKTPKGQARYEAALRKANEAIVNAESDYNKSLQDSIDSYINDVAAGKASHDGISHDLSDIESIISDNDKLFDTGIRDAKGDIVTYSFDRKNNATSGIKTIKTLSETKSYQKSNDIRVGEKEKAELQTARRENMASNEVKTFIQNQPPGGKK